MNRQQSTSIPGKHYSENARGEGKRLQSCYATVPEAGEAIIIQTPTAGGYGLTEA